MRLSRQCENVRPDPFILTVMPQTILIYGSGRSSGNTRRVVDLVLDGRKVEFVDLGPLALEYYRYEKPGAPEAFTRIAERIVDSDLIIFATPVYWYSMSGQMKVFLDQFSSLLYGSKPLGKALAGRAACLIACGSEAEIPEGFSVPFSSTCAYFEMSFLGSFYGSLKDAEEVPPSLVDRARAFGRKIFDGEA